MFSSDDPSRAAPDAVCPLSQALVASTFALSLKTLRGSESLAKLSNLLCLYDLTPIRLSVCGREGGLEVEMKLQGELRSFELYSARVRELVDIDHSQTMTILAEVALGKRPVGQRFKLTSAP